jgi:hypothetical protein
MVHSAARRPAPRDEVQMNSRNTRGLRLVVLVSLAGLAPDAWAYLDPSTGSMILSAIVGMFATAALAVKTYWYKLKALFRRRGSVRPASSGERRREGDRDEPASKPVD